MTQDSRRLKSSGEPLVSCYDCAMLDLDGVVYVGPHVVEGVPQLLEEARRQELTLAFVTNNAARTPRQIADHLQELGIAAEASDVVTSAQAAARAIAERVSPGQRVLVVGGEGLHEALRDRDLEPVSWNAAMDCLEPAGETPVAVAQGFSPSVDWEQLAYGAHSVRNGALWVASNLDLTIPTARGKAPGNGTLVNAIAAAVGHGPDVVAGKPFRPLFDETVQRTESRKPLVVGDRLDTDIEGAVSCGADALLVMTGVTDVRAAVSAANNQRPDYVASTLSGLLTTHVAPVQEDGRTVLEGWAAAVDGGEVVVQARGSDDDAGLRVILAAAWLWLDDNPERELQLDSLDRIWPST